LNAVLCLYLSMQQEMFQEYINQICFLTADGFDQLVPIAKSKRLGKGEVLFEKGQVSSFYYLVETGFLCNHYYTEGIITHTNFTFEGSFTADLKSMKEQLPSLISIEAGEEALVWVLDGKMLSERCMLSAEIMNFSRMLISRLLIEAEEYNNLLKLNKPDKRYEYIENNNPELLQRISIAQMASYLGVTEGTLTRIRQKKQ